MDILLSVWRHGINKGIGEFSLVGCTYVLCEQDGVLIHMHGVYLLGSVLVVLGCIRTNVQTYVQACLPMPGLRVRGLLKNKCWTVKLNLLQLLDRNTYTHCTWWASICVCEMTYRAWSLQMDDSGSARKGLAVRSGSLEVGMTGST